MTEWQPMTSEPNDGKFRFYGLHVHHAGLGDVFEAHYIALDDDGQLILPGGDNFDDWSFSDFEVWCDVPPIPAPVPLTAGQTSAGPRIRRGLVRRPRGKVMRDYYPLNDDPQLEICLTGKCDCANASGCKFARCKNCDMPAGLDGKTLTDWCGSGEIFEDRICPDCGAVLTRE